MSKADTNRGKDTERKVVAWLRDNGWPHAERTITTGASNGARTRDDLGDITGTPAITWQVKSLRPANRAERAVDGWMVEVAMQSRAASSDVGVLVVRREGTADVGEWWAWLSVHDLISLHGTFEIQPAGHVRMTVDQAATMLRRSGYGDSLGAVVTLAAVGREGT